MKTITQIPRKITCIFCGREFKTQDECFFHRCTGKDVA